MARKLDVSHAALMGVKDRNEVGISDDWLPIEQVHVFVSGGAALRKLRSMFLVKLECRMLEAIASGNRDLLRLLVADDILEHLPCGFLIVGLIVALLVEEEDFLIGDLELDPFQVLSKLSQDICHLE